MTHAQTEIIGSSLEAAAWEMCASLIRTAYSPNVKERADCSTAICDVEGRTLALATYAPAHLGSTLRLVPAILQRFPKESLRPGDIFFANDPYIVGVTHLNDCTVAAPIFADGELVAFAAAVAHHSDVGGRVPGSESGDSTSIFQEGIRVPPVKLVAAGELRRDVLEMFLLNSRTPQFSEGDILAQTAATASGTRRVQQLYARYGRDVVARCAGEMLDATERRIRSLIGRTLREGTYSSGDWLDEDGISDRPVKLAVTLTVRDGEVTFDFTECSAQLGSGKNIPYTHTMATVYYCVKAMVDPHLSINEGMYRPIKVVAPEGSVVNPRSPGGVGSRNQTSMILADVMIDALGQAAPDRAIAPAGPYQGIILSGWDPRRQRFFVDYENFAGGHGASVCDDGMDVTQIHMTNTSNLPIEVMEVEFPVRVERYEILCDSGGAGRHRGGAGVVRELRILNGDTLLACRSARQRFAAQGRLGGAPGTTGAFVLNPGGEARRLPSTSSELPLKQGDLLQIVTPGGGGFGEPQQRSPERVLADVLEGKVSLQAARSVYRVAIDVDAVAVDVEETARLRSQGVQETGPSIQGDESCA
ncbi:MAG TPA: hydantoinase B/oxoprolinase family protein [Burkholderiaceae bacterium]|nr:hydantoinase B/oxoprolinase family protein [Burkholderiaceae bacterium]